MRVARARRLMKTQKNRRRTRLSLAYGTRFTSVLPILFFRSPLRMNDTSVNDELSGRTSYDGDSGENPKAKNRPIAIRSFYAIPRLRRYNNAIITYGTFRRTIRTDYSTSYFLVGTIIYDTYRDRSRFQYP